MMHACSAVPSGLLVGVAVAQARPDVVLEVDLSLTHDAEQLQDRAVHLVGARVQSRLVALGGLEAQEDRTGELKRFFVSPEHRGAGIADALLATLVDYARGHDIDRLRLETGDRQHAAIAFYRRHGFVVVPRFGPYVNSATSVCMQRDLPRGA